eukprot:TRINITY_DN27132_c0_g1_i1.p1 TRINITY_DN27132_c0_g1~~TRINITY_DN27132_c0_g1_i1.p1  ORF type:complete len:315 (-),score=41.05 TRINITY_DN27132_c0_g1_i1:24-968(-)
MDASLLFSVYGGVLKTFFITVATQCFSLFQLYPHPNGKWSMFSDPQVLQGSPLWNDLVMAAVFAILINCLGCMCVFSYSMIIAPKYFHLLGFRKRWKFLMAKMRPSVHWWMLAILIKAVWLSLTSVLWKTVMRQALWLCLGILLYFTGSFVMLPWRSLVVSVLDVIMHGNLLLLCLLTPFLIDFKTEEKDEAANIYLCICGLAFFTVCAALSIMAYNLTPAYKSRQDAKTMKSAEKICRIFSKLDRPRLLADAQQSMTAMDIVVLTQVTRLIKTEMFAVRQPGRLQYREHEQGRMVPITDPEVSATTQTESVWV